MKNQTKRLFMDSGWYRLDYGKLALFWHICPHGPTPIYSHAHNDICSFVVYWKGCQIIVDPGRFNYKTDSLGLYGKKATSHNTFTIDGLEPYAIPRNIYPPRYREATSSVECEEKKDGFRFRISHTGFQRIGKGLLASREFYITENNFRIKDSVQGFGRHNVRTFFHFAKDAETATFNYSVAGENVVRKIISGRSIPEPMGWYFPRYGRALPIKTMVIETDVDFPYKAEYAIRFED